MIPMTRTEILEKKGLSADQALKVVIYADQGLRWIKGIDALNHQNKLDEFVYEIAAKPKAKVKEMANYVIDKYFAKDGEDVSREEFERRWRAGETIIK